jgi:hypothetical protein
MAWESNPNTYRRAKERIEKNKDAATERRGRGRKTGD